MPQRTPGPKSSHSHSFPSFYACYLLKSIQRPQSQATYIGSTPNPPRRIRQHNGEIAAGAWKTRHKRPWVMQMIVHGFPSRLAALQFEWAWQHPHISRHLRDATGKALFTGDRKSMSLKAKIQIVRLMISSHSYITWPLHVKLFTKEAVQGWNNATKDIEASPLPPGFTCSVELEGVDGRSGLVGSGRQGPINVNDETFTSAHLAKNTALLAANPHLKCSICHGPIANYTTDVLSTALCPTSTCTAVSHLTCLASQFLGAQTVHTGLVPRGGTCSSCHTYTLWGDIIRGCYRRSIGGALCEPEEEDIAEDRGDMPLSDDDNDLGALQISDSPTSRKVARTKAGSASVKTRKPRQKKVITADVPRGHASSEGELFDLDTNATDGPAPPRKRGRPRKVPLSNLPLTGPSSMTKIKATTIPKATAIRNNRLQVSDESGESFDFGAISEGTESSDDAPPHALITPRRGKIGRSGLDTHSPHKLTFVSPGVVNHVGSSKIPELISERLPLAGPTHKKLESLPGLDYLTSQQGLGHATEFNNDLMSAEDIVTRAMSSISVSSTTGMKGFTRRPRAIKVIEISD